MVWVIIGCIVLAIALIIFIALSLPVNVHIENVSNGELSLYVKILGIKFKGNEKSKSDGKVKQATEEFLGISKFKDLKSIKKTVKSGTLKESLTEFSGVIISLLKELIDLLKKCKVKKLYIKLVNAGDDAAEAAINYGASCAVIYTLIGYIESVAKVSKKATRLDLSCRYDTTESEFSYHLALSFRMYRILSSLIKVARQKAERKEK